MAKLEELLVKSQNLRHGLARAKRVKLVRSELNRLKRALAANDSTQSDGEAEAGDPKPATPKEGRSLFVIVNLKKNITTFLNR